MSVSKKKEELRKRLLEQRKNLDWETYIRGSNIIVDTLVRLPEFKMAETIHCYVSMNERQEVNTHELIKKMLPEKEVVVPVTNFDDGTLSHIRLSSFKELQENKWGVLEPQAGEEVSPKKLDLIIVPMVGGDELGNRIGYGKGFYDRFLKEVECPAIGLLFEQNIVSKIPVENFDIAMDKIITEKRIIT